VRATKRLSSVRRRASPHQHILNQFGESVQTCVPVTAFSARPGASSVYSQPGRNMGCDKVKTKLFDCIATTPWCDPYTHSVPCIG
jgi:hypothetical protein